MAQIPQTRDPRTYGVIGAAMEVHATLGPGFLESVYQESLEIELALRNIPFEPQVPLLLSYKGQPLRGTFRPDLFCHESLIVELKAHVALCEVDSAQVLNYLKATCNPVGLLLNFGAPRLEWKRIVLRAPNDWSAPSAASAVG